MATTRKNSTRRNQTDGVESKNAIRHKIHFIAPELREFFNRAMTDENFLRYAKLQPLKALRSMGIELKKDLIKKVTIVDWSRLISTIDRMKEIYQKIMESDPTLRELLSGKGPFGIIFGGPGGEEDAGYAGYKQSHTFTSFDKSSPGSETSEGSCFGWDTMFKTDLFGKNVIDNIEAKIGKMNFEKMWRIQVERNFGGPLFGYRELIDVLDAIDSSLESNVNR